MNENEERRAKQLTISAIEEYLNLHQTQLDMTSDYLLLDTFKNQLIKEVYGK